MRRNESDDYAALRNLLRSGLGLLESAERRVGAMIVSTDDPVRLTRDINFIAGALDAQQEIHRAALRDLDDGWPTRAVLVVSIGVAWFRWLDQWFSDVDPPTPAQ